MGFFWFKAMLSYSVIFMANYSEANKDLWTGVHNDGKTGHGTTQQEDAENILPDILGMVALSNEKFYNI